MNAETTDATEMLQADVDAVEAAMRTGDAVAVLRALRTLDHSRGLYSADLSQSDSDGFRVAAQTAANWLEERLPRRRP